MSLMCSRLVSFVCQRSRSNAGTQLWRWLSTDQRDVPCPGMSQREGDCCKGEGEGSIREAGGAFAKREIAREEKYFRDLTQSQIGAMRCELEERAKEKIARHEPLTEIDELALEAARQRKWLSEHDPTE